MRSLDSRARRRRAAPSILGLALLCAGAASACKDSHRDASQPVVVDAAAANSARARRELTPVFARPAFAHATDKTARQVSISDIAERCVRSVVNVRTTKNLATPRMPFPFEHPFGGPPPERRARSLGSGVILTADGVVLTNHHVVSKSGEIRLTMSDERELEAEIVGSDPKADLAVLRIKNPPKDLVPLAFGDSDRLRLGEVVLAIGNPFGVGQTVTMGIVSAKGRADMGIVDYEDFIQTDAAINPGNSGGALVNMRGELVGINTAILSRSGGYQGIGFTIPSKMARPIMQSLLQHGRVVRGWLGVVIQNLTKEMAPALRVPVSQGVVVSQVQEDSPAAKAGLARGDVIVELDGVPTRSVTRLRNAVAMKGSGARVKVVFYRADRRQEVTVALEELPGERTASIAPTHGALGGMTLGPLDDEVRRQVGLPRDVGGVVVRRIEPGSAAAAAGIRPGDVLLEINRQPLSNPAQFNRLYRATRGKLLLLVFREGGAMYLMLDK